MDLNSLPKFREVVEEKRFTEPFIRLDDVINKPIAVIDYVDTKFIDRDNRMVDKVHILIDVDDIKRVISTASSVLIKQVKTASELPFACKIVKVKSYYSFENI